MQGDWGDMRVSEPELDLELELRSTIMYNRRTKLALAVDQQFGSRSHAPDTSFESDLDSITR